MGIPKEERGRNRTNIGVILDETFLRDLTDTKHQMQKAKIKTSRINMKKSTPRHIISTLQEIKDKETIFKGVRGVKTAYLQKKKNKNCIGFSPEAIQARSKHSEIF